MTYLDTSALIKRFVEEKGSAVVQALVVGQGPVATAKIAYVEVYAGLTRKEREGQLTPRQYSQVSRAFEQEWAAYVRVNLQDDVLALARDLIRRHRLRAFDAIHLASAAHLQARTGEALTFAAADRRLLDAASAEGFLTLDVEAATSPEP